MKKTGVLLLLFTLVAIASAYATDVKVNTWNDPDTQHLPEVAALPNGNFVITWRADYDTNSEIYGVRAKYYQDTEAVLLDDFMVYFSSYNLEYPDVAGLATNGFVVVWYGISNIFTGEGLSVRGDIYDSSGGYVATITPDNFRSGPCSQINTCGWAWLPRVAGLANGDFVVTWTSGLAGISGLDGSGDSISYRVYTSTGIPLTPERVANTITTGDQVVPEVAGLENGNFVISWHFNNSIYMRLFAANGNALSPADILVASGTSHAFVAGLANPSSEFIVGWIQGSNIYVQRFDSIGNTVGSPIQVNTLPVYVGSLAQRPSASSLLNGGFVVAYVHFEPNPIGYNVYVQEFDASSTKVGGESRVNTVQTNSQTEPDVSGILSGSHAGEYIVTWQSLNQIPTNGWDVYYTLSGTLPGGTTTSTSTSTTSTISANCTLNSVSLLPYCTGGASIECEQNENIQMTASFTGDCSATTHVQVDALDLSCDIQYAGGTLSGITASSFTVAGNEFIGNWTIPIYQGSACEGVIIDSPDLIAGALWNGVPGTGIQISSTTSLAGTFSLYSPGASSSSTTTISGGGGVGCGNGILETVEQCDSVDAHCLVYGLDSCDMSGSITGTACTCYTSSLSAGNLIVVFTTNCVEDGNRDEFGTREETTEERDGITGALISSTSRTVECTLPPTAIPFFSIFNLVIAMFILLGYYFWKKQHQ